MRKRFSNIFIIAFLFSSIFCNAQWSTSPLSHNIIGVGKNIKIVGDGEGGCYVIFEHGSVSPNSIGILKLNKYGEHEWPEYVGIKGTRDQQMTMGVIADGAGSMIIAYSDMNYMSPALLRLQKINKLGQLLWSETGLWIDSTSSTMQALRSIISDGENGCVVTWIDSLFEVRMNRVTHNGKRMWGDGGIYKMPPNNSNYSKLVRTSQDKYIYIMDDLWKWYDNQGNLLMTDTTTYTPVNVMATNDGGVVFETFDGEWPENWNMYLQKIDSIGQPSWGGERIHIADSLFYNSSPRLYKNDNFFISSWLGKKDGIEALQSQFIRQDGSKILNDDGLTVYDSLILYTSYSVIPSLKGNTIFTWYEWLTDYTKVLKAQKFDSLGTKLWKETDIDVSYTETGFDAIPDEMGGYIYFGQMTDFQLFADQVSVNGNLGEVIITSFNESVKIIPRQIKLFQNYPNPFNPSTSIKYQLPEKTHVKVEVFNLLGQSVKILVDEVKPAGYYETEFTTVNLASGVYICNIKAGKFDQSVKMVYMK